MFAVRCDQKGLDWKVEWSVNGGVETAEEREEWKTTKREGERETLPQLSPPSRILVNGDEGKLRQILINLVSNAVKFTESGEIILRVCEDVRKPESQNIQHPDSSRLFRFHVIDTGIGISPEERTKILEPFAQGEDGEARGGTGLGLAIAQKMIELMGGELYLESELGRGSHFWFTIPLLPAIREVPSAEDAVGRAVVHLADGYHVTALVVDDVAENRDVLSKILSDIGVEVTTSGNGQEAIKSVRSNPPEIVFMDIRMPVMDGKEAALQIWEETGHETIKIVAISASSLTHQKAEYLSVGFDGFISKPFLAERIYKCLAELLQVEYEYEEGESAESLDLTDTEIPSELLSRLKEASEFYDITELKVRLSELAQLGAEEQRLAEHLSSLLNTYDMDGILSVLARAAQSMESL
jgi:CheY-like chemotaxis protein